jgi:hypothetical protein
MKTLKEQVVEVNKNQNHILEAINHLNQRLEHLEEKFKDDKINNLQDILESQETMDAIIVKNSNDIILMKKKKEENEELIKSLEEKICTIDKDIATMTTNLQNKFERLRIEVAKVKYENKLKVKCKFFNIGFCRMKENCPFLHKSLDMCDFYKNGTNCQNQNCDDRHPKCCRYFKRGSCFRKESCLYFHKHLDGLENERNNGENMNDQVKNTDINCMEIENNDDASEYEKDEFIENEGCSGNDKEVLSEQNESSDQTNEVHVECARCTGCPPKLFPLCFC